MPSQVFYAWFHQDASEEAIAKGEALIARLRSDSVEISAIAGGYRIAVRGADFKACQRNARPVMDALRGGSLKLGQNPPPHKPTEPEPRGKQVVPPPTLPSVVMQKPRPAPAAPVAVSVAPIMAARKPQSRNGQVDPAQVTRVLNFMRSSCVTEMKAGLLSSRLFVSKQYARRCLQVLKDRGLVEELPAQTYRLSAKGREGSSQ